MAYPYSSGTIPRQSDEEFASWLAGRGHDIMSFLDESGARANPAAHPPSNTVKIGDAVRSPADAAAAMPKPVDPLTARLERHAAMTDDLGLAANERTAAQMDEVDRAYQRGEGNLSEASPAELRHALGFEWGKGVDVDPATGRPRSNSTISTYDGGAQGRTSIAANESQGGGGVSTLGEGPRFRNIQPWQVEDVGRAADVAAAERSVDEPLWLQRAIMEMDVDKAGAIEGNRAHIQAGVEGARRGDYVSESTALAQEEAGKMARLESTPGFAGLPKEEQMRRRGIVSAVADQKRQALKEAFGFGGRVGAASIYKE